MEIDKSLILKLEKLSRLTFNEKEREELTTDLSKILNMVKKLDEIDTSKIAPLTHVGKTFQPLREDKVQQTIDRKKALRNAPDHNDLFFKVPKVIEQNK